MHFILVCLGYSYASDEFKCYKCVSILDEYCSDIDALKAMGDEAQITCTNNKQCLYTRESKQTILKWIELYLLYGVKESFI